MRYTCAICGRTFDSGTTEEEDRAQFHAEFPWLDFDPDECVRICDDCFKAGYEGPEYYQEEFN